MTIKQDAPEKLIFLCVRRLGLGLAILAGAWAGPANSDGDTPVITPGSDEISLPPIEDYEARYTSSFSKTGEFTLQVRKTGDGKTLSLIDIIPGETMMIVSQRQIDLASFGMQFSAGPYFAWGPEYIVAQSNGKTYDWSRTPLGGGDPKRASGAIANGGYMTEMFSPLLASLMPRDVGARFKVPDSYARKGEFVSSELDDYRVMARERLDTPSGLSCHCWVIEKKTWGGSTEHIWVAREAPFVFKRQRDVGGPRSFVSDLTSYRLIEK